MNKLMEYDLLLYDFERKRKPQAQATSEQFLCRACKRSYDIATYLTDADIMEDLLAKKCPICGNKLIFINK